MVNKLQERLVSFWSLTWLLTGLFAVCTTSSTAEAEVDVWQAFSNGEAVALMRHAIAPGNGDPAEFILGDCKTQRNLSKDGVLQAQKIGLQLKEHGIEYVDVFSSQWCRCVDTAVNLDLGTVKQLPMLNSFYQDRSTEEAQTTQIRQWIVNRLASKSSDVTDDQLSAKPALLVTHQVNITALTGVVPASGEVVFVAMNNGQLTVLTTWISDF